MLRNDQPVDQAEEHSLTHKKSFYFHIKSFKVYCTFYIKRHQSFNKIHSKKIS